MAKNYDILLKILLLGDTGSCKTDLLQKFVGEDDTDDNLDTLGLDYRLKDIAYKGKKIKLQLWDTAGQERFRSLTSSYYRGSQGCVLAFHVGKVATFSGLSYWLDEIKKNATDEFQVVLVAIGYNGGSDTEVDLDAAREFAKENQLPFTTVDLDNSEQVKSVFDLAVEKIMSESLKRKTSDPTDSIRIDSGRSDSGQACFC